MKTRSAKTWKNRIRFGRRSSGENLHKKKRRLKYIAVLPSFITLMNGACGFMAIVFASRSIEQRWRPFFNRGFSMTFFSLAGYMIFLAMIADVMDGGVARLTRTTSSFGGQLDSLSDAISFGAAPAFLMLKMAELHFEYLRIENFRFTLLIKRGIFFAAIFYAMCALVRLARFNVENEEDVSAHMYFAGLPSPAAAGVVVSLVIFYQELWIRFTGEPVAYHTLEIITIIALPLITLISGILMVSRIRYPHFTNHLLRGKKPLPMLLLLFAAALLIFWNIQLATVIGFCGFALFGVVRWIIVSIVRKRPVNTIST